MDITVTAEQIIEVITQINAFAITKGNPDIDQISSQIKDLLNQLKDKKISEDEFKELSSDILDMKHIDNLAKNLQDRAMLEGAIHTLSGFLNTLKFVI